MLKLYKPTSKLRIVQQERNADKGLVKIQIGDSIFYNSKLDAQSVYDTHFGPIIQLAERYVLIYSAREHSRGATLYNHRIECLSINGRLKFVLQGQFSNQVAVIERNQRIKHNSFYLLRFINGFYHFNNYENHGKTGLEVIKVSLAKGEIQDRRKIEIPEHLKSFYDSKHISSLRASFMIKKKKGLLCVKCEPFIQSHVTEEISFTTELSFI